MRRTEHNGIRIRAIHWGVLVMLAAVVFCGFAGRVHAATTRASLILASDTARPGDTVMAGIRLRMQPRWHTYWRNPGGSGIATKVAWDLPKGVTAGEVQWPIPEKLPADELTTYIYTDEVVLIVPLKLASDVAAGPLELAAKVSWLECEVQCIPGSANVHASLSVGAETKPSADAANFDTWQKKMPLPGAGLAAKAWWEKSAHGDTRPLILEWPAAQPVQNADFYPDSSDKFDVQSKTDSVAGDAGRIRIRKEVKKLEGNWPEKISGLLVGPSADGTVAYEVSLPIGVSKAAGPGLPIGAATGSLWQKLLYAFLGGLILNVMPCVLPVIALKILGFVNQGKEEPRQVRKLGLIYGAGVLVSFLALALLVIGAKLAGHAASWGMQFQNPQFVVAMTVLVTLVALNLFGVFEINLSGRVMGAAGNLAAKEGNAGAFFNGVLATALATPCTAPALGVALGFAFTQKPLIIVLMFLTVGAGLAAPYVVLSWQPAWLRLLPKPGAWMERFKMAMGFPMLATAVWLFTLAAPNFGENGDLWLGMFLVLMGLVAWVWGQFVQRGRSGRGLAMAVSIALFVIAYAFVLEGELDWRHPMAVTPGSGKLSAAPEGIDWQPWSPEAIAAARATGRPVLVDFTAKWCLTCQTVVRPALESASVRAKLKELNAVALLENSFVKDATVVAELNRYERAGVPLVLVYPRDPDAPPQVLPEVLTSGVVVRALEKAAMQGAPPASASNQ